MKLCHRCRKQKPLDGWPAMAARRDGLHPWCRDCKNEYQRTRRHGPKGDAQREYDRQRRKDPARRAYTRAKERVRRGKLAAGDVTMVDLATLASQNGPNCSLCGKPLGDDITLEHKTPLARGGSHTLANLALAHRLCNMRKGRLTMEEWDGRQGR